MIPLINRAPDARRISGWEWVVPGLLLAIGVGGWWVGRQYLATIRAAHVAAVAETNAKIAQLREENASLRREQEGRFTASTDRVAGRVTVTAGPPAVTPRVEALLRLAEMLARDPSHAMRLRFERMRNTARAGLSKMRAQNAQKLGIAAPPESVAPAFLMDSTGRLPPRFGELFDFGEADRARLEQALGSIVNQINARILAHATVHELSNGKAVLNVEPVPDAEAAGYRDQFVATFQAIAGAERYRAFALLNGEHEQEGVRRGGPADFFNSFASEAARTVSVSREQHGYRFEIRRVDGQGRQSGNAPDLASLRERVGPLIQLLPAGF